MISGARIGPSTWLRRLAARAVAQDLTAFVAPGHDRALAAALDLAAAGLTVTDSPRHADVLVLVGDLPEGLHHSVAVVYAQMPRPRAVLAVGAPPVPTLPPPDVAVATEQGDLVRGVEALRARFAAGAWASDSPVFAIGAAHLPHDDYGEHHGSHAHTLHEGDESAPNHAEGHDHHDAGHAASQGVNHAERHHVHARRGDPEPTHGEVGKVGKVGKEHTAPDDHADDGDHGQGKHEDTGTAEEASHKRGAPHAMAHNEQDKHGDPGEMGDIGGMGGIGGMDMGGAFMSMVMMTQDLPRSADGLPMEWGDVPFGPFFPGLPGGLALAFTLDGDTVVNVGVTTGMVSRHLAVTWPGPAATFPERLARLDPLAPIAYRLLAVRALEAVAGIAPSEAAARARVGAAERERAASHLAWLAQFAILIGARAVATRAMALGVAVRRLHDAAALPPLQRAADAFVTRVARTPFLALRLRGIARDYATERLGGPVARAAGGVDDARANEPVYHALGFRLSSCQGADAWARLHVRLDEITRSLALVAAAGAIGGLDARVGAISGDARTTVETPRGPASLHVIVRDGFIHAAHLEVPSTRLLTRIEAVTTGQEIADALVGAASLDLSPWEVDG